jgi:hypothetical protein
VSQGDVLFFISVHTRNPCIPEVENHYPVLLVNQLQDDCTDLKYRQREPKVVIFPIKIGGIT